MVRVAHLPDHPPAPVHFEDGAAFEAPPGLEPLEVLHDFAAIEEMTVVEQITVEPRPVRHAPRVSDLAFHVDEVDGAVTEHRREQRVAQLGSCRIVCDEPRPGAPDLLLIHGAHRSPMAKSSASLSALRCEKLKSIT